MLISRLFLSGDPPILTQDDYEDSPEHQELKERLRKTLYYGRNPKTERPSLPVTEIAVELLQDAAPRELGRVDEFVASSLSHKASVSPCALMIGLIYIERLKHRNPEYLQKISSSDLFLISMMVASKYLYDEGVEEEVFNDEWSEAANMEVADLNELEMNFLSAIDWNLFVKDADFRKVLTNIERRVAVRKGRERGFYSYSDLMVLGEIDKLHLLIREIMVQLSKIVLVCSVAYAASVLTLLGSSVSLGFIRQHSHAVPNLFVLPSVIDSTSTDLQFDRQVSSFHHEILDSDLLESRVDVQPNANLSEGNDGTTMDTDDDEGFDDESDRTETNQGVRLKTNELGKGQQRKWRNSKKTAASKRPLGVPQTPRMAAHDLRPQVTFPNFLTLSVIRDTLVQFLLALRDQRTNGVDKDNDNGHNVLQSFAEKKLVCSCGCCQDGVHPRCQNATVRGLDGGDSCWKTGVLNDLESDWLPCNIQQCCCPSTVDLGPWHKFTSEVNDPLNEVRKGFQTMRLIDAIS